MVNFHCYVSLPEGTPLFPKFVGHPSFPAGDPPLAARRLMNQYLEMSWKLCPWSATLTQSESQVAKKRQISCTEVLKQSSFVLVPIAVNLLLLFLYLDLIPDPKLSCTQWSFLPSNQWTHIQQFGDTSGKTMAKTHDQKTSKNKISPGKSRSHYQFPHPWSWYPLFPFSVEARISGLSKPIPKATVATTTFSFPAPDDANSYQLAQDFASTVCHGYSMVSLGFHWYFIVLKRHGFWESAIYEAMIWQQSTRYLFSW